MPFRFAAALLAAVLLAAVLLAAVPVAAQTPSAAQQIALAVQAAPEPLRASATVLGYAEEDGAPVQTLRAGDGDLICLADAPGDDRFHAACYHRALATFMERGRVLRRQNVADVDSVRRAEIEAGAWSMPERPAALYNLTAPAADVDVAAGTVQGGARLHVVYLPYATGAGTGLPTRPAGRGPWLMEAGAPWAHVMYGLPE